MNIKTIQYDSFDGKLAATELRKRLAGGLLAGGQQDLDVPAIVRDIITQVKDRGDSAAAKLTSKLDLAEVTSETVRIPEEDILAAHKQADPAFLKIIRSAAANIREYQQSILVSDPPPLVRDGRTLGVRYTPMDRVGVYVPGGRAIYPSTVLMTVVPAQVAGVRQIVMASPPTGGQINPMALALAGELGITEVIQLGGAVAMAALAYGTETITPVNKIVGPGNAFVAEAKRQLFGIVGIDSIAGPSEVVIVADDTANANEVAADMIAQAEHNPGWAMLVTPSQKLADDVKAQLDIQLPLLTRGDEAKACIEAFSSMIITGDMDQACEVANDFAAEHLQIVTADNPTVLSKIRNAGAIFLGPHTPVSLGDYYAGPSHVLPTGSTAKFFGPLNCNDFRKATSIIEYDRQSLCADGPDVIDFATHEGLTAHARAVSIRTENDSQ